MFKKSVAILLSQFHHCDCEICEWLNFGTFFKFPCIVQIYAWFFMHCRNHHSDSHNNHVIKQCIVTDFNTLRLRQNGRHFIDNIFKCIFFNENVWIPIKISLKFVPKGPINNIPALVQMMAWHQLGDKPLSELIMARLLMHIYVTLPQRVNVEFTLVFRIACLRPRNWTSNVFRNKNIV